MEDWHRFANWEDCYTVRFCLWLSIHPRCLCRWVNARAPKERTDAPSPVPSLENQQGVLQKMQLSLYAVHCGQLTYASISSAAQRECSYTEALPTLFRLLAKTGTWDVATPRGNICCCCQQGFSCSPQLGGCSPLAAPAAAWASALSTCSPHMLLLLLWVRKGSNTGQADVFLLSWFVLVKAFQTYRSTYWG